MRYLLAVAAVGASLLSTIAAPAQNLSLRLTDVDLYRCLSGEPRDGLDCRALAPKISMIDQRSYLRCYRQCLSQCQEVSATVGDERLCADTECLIGGSFGC